MSSLSSLCATVISQLFVLYLSSLLFIWRQWPIIKLKFIAWHATSRIDSSLMHWNISIVQLNTFAQLQRPLLTSNHFSPAMNACSNGEKNFRWTVFISSDNGNGISSTYNIPKPSDLPSVITHDHTIKSNDKHMIDRTIAISSLSTRNCITLHTHTT